MVADLFLLPGLLCDSRLWRQQMEGLAGAACCVVPDLTAHDTIAAMADAVLGAAPAQFALAGFSLGSCVALEVFARAPERVARLALLSSAVHGLPEAVRRHYLESIPAIESGGLGRYLADAFPRYVAPARVHDRAVWEVFAAMGESLGPDVAVRQMKALLAYPGGDGGLAAIRCPTAVLCGAEDHRATPTAQAELASQIPGASLRVIEGAGHFTPLEAPVAVTEALRDWLRRPRG